MINFRGSISEMGIESLATPDFVSIFSIFTFGIFTTEATK